MDHANPSIAGWHGAIDVGSARLASRYFQRDARILAFTHAPPPIWCSASCQHGAELLSGFRQEFARAPVHNDTVATDEVEHVELAVPVPPRDVMGVFVKPFQTAAADMGSLGERGFLIDLVVGEIRIDFLDDDTIVFFRTLERDIAVGNVVTDSCGVTLQRIAQTASARGRTRDDVAGLQRDVREQRSEIALTRLALIDPNTMGQ
jgi:hypothetical protein